MAKRKFDFAILGIVVLVLCVGGGLFLSSGTFRDMMEARRRAAEGWDIVKIGSFKPVHYEQVGDDVNAPLANYQGGASFETGAVMYFKSLLPFPDSDEFGGDAELVKSSYAKLVLPSGAYLLMPINRNSRDPYLAAVQIPAVHSPKTGHMEIHVFVPGGTETVVRIDKPPTTKDIVPQDGPTVNKVKDGDITVEGEAFAVTDRKTASVTGVGYRLQWTTLPKGLFWRASIGNGNLRPFVKPGREKELSSSSASTEADKAHSIGLIESVPYASEIEKVNITGKLDGFAFEEEEVDFGTVKVFRVPASMTSNTSPVYCLDTKKPIEKKLKSGLVLALLPLRNLKDQNSYLGGDGLYFRLLAKPETLATGLKMKPLGDEKPQVEVKLHGVVDYMQTISPELNPAQKPELSNLVMLWWKPPASMTLPLKFTVRRLVLQRRVPIELRLPIDKNHPRVSRNTNHTLHSGSEFIN